MPSPLRSSSFLRRATGPPVADTYGILSQDLFGRMLYIERKRTERSGRSFVLMLLESAKLLKADGDPKALQEVLLALSTSTRDTDAKGWHKEGSTLGIIFTELGADADGHTVAKALLNKVTKALTSTLTIDRINEIRLSFHVFPENWQKRGPESETESSFYDDALYGNPPHQLPRAIKRSMDIAGSLLAILLSLPLFVAIALAIKLTSAGPVLFRQPRLGLYGRKFTFLKFRSMYLNADQAVHREYVKRFIANADTLPQPPQGSPTYKLTSDPRVTTVGRFLRKTSLDELPQFFNVLIGDMSLVGPRPPIPYEAASYHVWHRARLLAVKPGITGPWQVGGRSRVKFDDMVRMDLRYADSWSLWLDIKILLRTPLAVLSAKGAL